MTEVRITTLVENTVRRRGLLAEHGLAFWIEVGNRRILFDAGQTDILQHNARHLGIPLETADAVILSHGHYDHTGGLPDVLAWADGVPLYAHPAVFAARYAKSPDRGVRSVGMAARTEEAIRHHTRLIPVERPMEVCPGLHVTGPIPRTTDFEDVGGAFFLDKRCTQHDPVADDQAAFIPTPAGTLVILGCAHAGVINTLRYIRELTDFAPIHTVIGGMHLLQAGEDRMNQTILALNELDVGRFIPAHCTGFAATTRLWHEFPRNCTPAGVGMRI